MNGTKGEITMAQIPMVQNAQLCDIAKERLRNAARWLNLWNGLLWVFGAAVVISLGAMVLLSINERYGSAGAAGVATIASGAAVAWVVTRRTDAKTEEKEAFD